MTGIGFLGAGTILRNRDGVHGLTTAATVWVNAALGVAAGGGQFRLAIIGGAITLAVLLVLGPIEAAIEMRAGPKRTPSSGYRLIGRGGRGGGIDRAAAGRPASIHACVIKEATPPVIAPDMPLLHDRAGSLPELREVSDRRRDSRPWMASQIGGEDRRPRTRSCR